MKAVPWSLPIHDLARRIRDHQDPVLSTLQGPRESFWTNTARWRGEKPSCCSCSLECRISPAFCMGGCCMTCCHFPCPRCMGWCWALVLKVFLVLTPVLTELWWEVLNYAHNRVKGLLFSARSFKKTPLCWAVPAAVRSQGGHVQQLDSEIVSRIPPVRVFWEVFCIAWVLFKEFLKQNCRERCHKKINYKKMRRRWQQHEGERGCEVKINFFRAASPVLLLESVTIWFIKVFGICQQGESWGKKQTF